jgi:GT2 family glycosyltransferase/glycosyltransferase involved in cell wall biosynthesis
VGVNSDIGDPEVASPVESSLFESPSACFEEVSDPVVTIVVLGWGSAPHLLDCLRALSRIERSVSFEVIITLNEPTPELAKELTENVHGARIIQSRVNLGYGGACNAAVEVAAGRYIVLLNDDTIVDRYWLGALVETAEANPRISAVGSLLFNIDGSMQESGSLLFADGSTTSVSGRGTDVNHRWDWARRVDYCSGASLLVRKSIWDRLGGFDEIYYPAYFEDVDLCLRIQEIGHQVWIQPQSRARHIQSASVDESYKVFLTLRNRKQIVKRWSHVLAQRLEQVGTGDEIEETATWVGMGRPNRILVIDDRIPASSLGSGFGRMIDAFSELTSSGDHFVSLYPAMTSEGSRSELCRIGVRILEGDLEAHLQRPHINYDVVIISRPHNYEAFGSIVRKHQPQAAVIYDAEALYFRRKERQALLSDDPVINERLRAEARSMQESEHRYFSDADQAICISDLEADFARTLDGAPPVHVIEARLHDPQWTEQSFRQRRDVIFVAGWLSGAGSPNGDGLTWFVQKVLPLVRARIPWVRVRVTGQDPPTELLQYASPSIVFEGHVGDIAKFYDDARVAIVPMRFGAGVKLKAIEALQYGVPTVSTTIGAEGIDLHQTGALAITDDAAEFAFNVATLLDNPQLWEDRRERIRAMHDIWAQQPAGTSWSSVIETALADRVSTLSSDSTYGDEGLRR